MSTQKPSGVTTAVRAHSKKKPKRLAAPNQPARLPALPIAILQLLYVNARFPVLDLIGLQGALERLRHKTSLTDLVASLQELEARGYVVCVWSKSHWTGHRIAKRIGITKQGTEFLFEKMAEVEPDRNSRLGLKHSA